MCCSVNKKESLPSRSMILSRCVCPRSLPVVRHMNVKARISARMTDSLVSSKTANNYQYILRASFKTYF